MSLVLQNFSTLTPSNYAHSNENPILNCLSSHIQTRYVNKELQKKKMEIRINL